MRKRAVQMVVLIALGLGLGLLLSRDWRTSEPPRAVPAPRVEPAPSPPLAAPKAPDSERRPSSAGVFKLPAMRPPLPEPAAEPARPTVRVPRYWLLRGTTPQNYDLLSDRLQVSS